MAESHPLTQLRQELARVRDQAGLSQRTLGDMLGASYGTVYRYERGPTLPSLPRIRRWLDACDVDSAERDRLLELADRARSETRPWKELLNGPVNPQEDLREIEQDATSIRVWHPTIIPGVLQAPEYATAVMDACWTTDVVGGLRARMARQSDLYTSPTRHHFLITEEVWRARWAPDAVAEAQRARAQELARLDTVELGVLPATVLTAPAWTNFALYTSSTGVVTVVRELTDGMSTVGSLESVERHEIIWRRLVNAAEPPYDVI